MNEAFKSELDRLIKGRDSTQKLIDLLQSLEDIPTASMVYGSNYGSLTLSVSAGNGEDARAAALYLQSRVRKIVGTAEHIQKSFIENTGQVSYKILGLPGVSLEVTGGVPTRCKVKKIVETVAIPERILPATTETRVKYVIENPEECGAVG